MALEVQINSTNAQQALNAIERGINAVIARMDALASAPGVDTFAAKLSQLRGINPAVISSISAFDSATRNLAGSYGAITRLASGLDSLARVDIARVTQNMQGLGTALSALRIPPNIPGLASALNTIATAANTATAGVARLNASLNSVNVGTLQVAAQAMNRVGQQTQQAGAHLSAFNTIGNYTIGMLTAMGVSFAASGIINFIQDAYRASVTMDAFMVSMRMATGSNEGAAQSFAYLREVARQTGQPIEALIPSFRRFEQAAVSAGYSIEQSQATYTKFSAVFRTFGLTSEQTKRAFTALEQMISKGTISMEELRQQLGENVPAFNALERAINAPNGQLAKLISQGKVSAANVGLLADEMFKAAKSTGAFDEALKKPQARLAAWQSQLFEFQIGFGNNFIKPVLAGLDNLSKAFGGQENMIKFGETMGWLAGNAIKLFIDGISVLVAGFGELYRWCRDVVTGFQLIYSAGVALGQTLVQVFQDIGQGIATVWNGIVSFDLSQIQLGVNQLAGSVTDLGGKMQTNFNTMRDSVLGAKKAVDSNNGSMSVAERATRDLNTPVGELTKSTNGLTASTNSTANAFNGAANAANNAAASYQNAARAASSMNSVSAGGGGKDITQMLNQRAENEYQKRVEWINTPTTNYDPNAPIDAGYSVRRNQVENGNFGYTGPSGYDSIPYYTGLGAADNRWQTFGPGAGYFEGETFKAGGISHIGGNGRVRVPVHAFANARHFADGGISNGGIPSILHPNEAVIPLQNGGVPVNLNTGNSRLDPIQSRQLQCLYDINQGIAEVRQTAIDLNVLTIDEFKTTQSAIRDNTSILTGLRDACDKIPDGISKLQSVIDDLGNRLSSSIDASATAASYSLDQINSSIRAIPATGGGSAGSTNIDNPASRYYTADDGTVTLKPSGGVGFALGSPNAYRDSLHAFAIGSPNASVDARGGFHAILHPDEAVVPLPDGRSIPVELRNEAQGSTARELAAYERESASSRARDDASNAPPTQIVNNIRVTINAKDAASFKQSETQMLQDFAQKMARAARVSGKTSRNDLTKRAT